MLDVNSSFSVISAIEIILHFRYVFQEEHIMKKTSIATAITFIENWTQQSFIHVNEAELSLDVPNALHKLDKSLGAFWGNSSFPFDPGEFDHNTKRGLFNNQDQIVNPRMVNTEVDVIPLIHENQGVWNFGYTRDFQLMFSGDWALNGKHVNSTDWTPFPADVEDALTYCLLSNFFLYMISQDNFTQVGSESSHLDDFSVLLWSHPAWGNFRGFLTDSEAEKLAFDGFGVITRV